ncbi:hypothetical protein AB0I68_07925 [Streptomyces sp. NPDC050448]|uniref:hypothetical protein n=1 Tax=Streptomyces sp. NPDC050448 TaxID=3155404 RepID=UPI00343DB9C3
MRTNVGRGRIHRRCGCGDTHHRQLGAHCPHLVTDSEHDTWSFAVDVPTPDHRRTTVRRSGFPTQDSAEKALGRFLEGEAGGYNADPRTRPPPPAPRSLRRLRSPAVPGFSATADRPQTAHATTLRPTRPRTHERPSSHG